MNCKYCNAVVPEDSAFCPDCGAKVEAPVEPTPAPAAEPVVTFCPNCGAAMAEPTGFCENCGAKVEAPEAAPAPKKGISPKFLKLGIIAVAAIVLIVVLIAIFSGGSKPNYALYIKDSAIQAAKMPSGKPAEISDEYSSTTVWMTADGKTIFYVEDGDLVYKDSAGEKDSTKVVSGVSSFAISANGKKVVYLKEGKLYTHDLKDPTKIDSDVTAFWVTDDCKTILYKQSSEGKVTLYKKTGTKESVKIASGESISISDYTDDLKTIVFKLDGDLYTQTGTKDKEKVASDASMVGSYYDGAFYYKVDEEETVEVTEGEGDYTYTYEETIVTSDLFYYTGKKSVEIAKEIGGTSSYGDEKAAILYYVTEDEETTYYVATKDKVAEIKADDLSSVQMNEDGTSVLLMRNVDAEEGVGVLYEAAISGTKMKEAKKIAEDVYYTGYGYVDGKPYYYTDVEKSEGTLYIDGKKIRDDVSIGVVYMEDLNVILFMTDVEYDQETYSSTYTLWYVKGSKTVKIADEIYSLTVTPADNLLILTEKDKNGEGVLSVFTGSKTKKVDEDVSGICYVIVPDGVSSVS